MFSNCFPRCFSQECKSHNLSALQWDIGPFVEGSDGFKRIVTTSEKFQWVLVPMKDGKPILYVSRQSTHAVCASNQDVISAGEGFFRDLKLYLNNRTGHYRASFESVKHSLVNWRSQNIEFKDIVCEDFLADVKEAREYIKKKEIESAARREMEKREERDWGCGMCF